MRTPLNCCPSPAASGIRAVFADNSDMGNALAELWDQSYLRRENFVFYPQEEIVRFMARYVRRRVGLEEFEDRRPLGSPARGLDLGCGIGRHMVFMWDFRIEPYGIDLSASAIETARKWAQRAGIPLRDDQLHCGSVTQLPWDDGHFDIALSHGVLDSMPFATAQQAMPELHRVLRPGGLFYCDLVSSDDDRHPAGFDGEEVVQTQHEQGTIQSYFTPAKIQRLFGSRFKTLDVIHIKSHSIRAGVTNARYHLVLEKA